MDFDDFPEPFQEELKQSLRVPLRNLLAEGDPDLPPGAACTWHESCRVLTLDLPDDFVVGESLAPFTRPGEDLWHHQIKVDGRPLLYARSIVEEGHCHLIQVMHSVIAERFDASLSALEAIPGDAIVRLLQIPGYNDETFALCEGDQIVGLVPMVEVADGAVAPPPPPPAPAPGALDAGGVNVFAAHAAHRQPPSSLLTLLKEKPRFFGLHSGTQRKAAQLDSGAGYAPDGGGGEGSLAPGGGR
jgi:hypothetical protein